MWENRSVVPNPINSPCQNCKDRKIPKTCENTCSKWLQYKKEKEIFDKQEQERKDLKKAFSDNFDRLEKVRKNHKRCK